jgi:hypothetical protein
MARRSWDNGILGQTLDRRVGKEIAALSSADGSIR